MAAAIGGGIVLAIGPLPAGGWVALGGFAIAIAAELYSAIAKPDRIWYEGRAAAESAKTLAWRYAVRGEPFGTGTSDSVDSKFVAALSDLLHDLHGAELSGTGVGEQITHEMRDARLSSFDVRRAIYRDGRIESQRAWYASKADSNSKLARLWTAIIVSAEVLGIAAGAAIVGSGARLDVVGVFAAVAAVGTAWAQAKQHRALSTAYRLTVHELAGVKSELGSIGDESDWPGFVHSAEEAISREHTMWRATRGVRP